MIEEIWIKKNDILENILVEKLVFWWKGFAILKHSNPIYDGRVIFITGSAIPWSTVNLRVIKKKNSFLETQIVDIIKKSPFEEKNVENIYWECGGCKWVNIKYDKQLEIKQWQIEEALNILNKYDTELNSKFSEIEPSPKINWYRNKVEFSFWKYISQKYNIEEHFNVWFHKQWEFSKIQDFDWCILIDELQNEIYYKIKSFSKTLGLPVYDQFSKEWFFRHILIRRTHFSDEIMLLLSFNPEYFEKNIKLDKNEKMNLIKDFLISLPKQYFQIKSIYFSHNINKSDTCIWDLELIYWKKTIKEKLLWLEFNISPTSFFQTNSTWAEKLYSIVLDFAKKENIKNHIVLDLYWWTWTIWMIFAKAWAKKVISVELVSSSSNDWKQNAKLNKLDNIEFENSKVEDFLEKYLESNCVADLLIIDPARAWMHPKALPNILKFNSHQIIYVSCNPATLARDLEYILENGDYKIEKVKGMDMFPHTHHIETVVSLIKNS